MKFFNLTLQAFSANLQRPYLQGTNVKILKASTQVVNGLNYKIEVEISKILCGFKQSDTNRNLFCLTRRNCLHRGTQLQLYPSYRKSPYPP
ncbi:uncharacterized protein LOC144133961 [Amblyomma americanum]